MVEFKEEQVEELKKIAEEMDTLSGEAEDPDLDDVDHEDLIAKYNIQVKAANKLIGEIVAEMRAFEKTADEDFKAEHGEVFSDWIGATEEGTCEEAAEIDDILDGSDLLGIPTNIEDA